MPTRIWLLVAVMVFGAAAQGAPAGQDPYVGYVYPAGGQQGSVFRVTVGGQRLRGVREAYVSGNGVRASVVAYQPPAGPLNAAQQDELRRRLQELRAKRTGGPAKADNAPSRSPKAPAGSNAPDGAKAPAVALPDIPELRNLEQMTPKQLQRVAAKYVDRSKRPKPPIGDEVTLEVTMDPDAEPGDRELRLLTPAGLTNPVLFQVGQIPEVREPDREEVNDVSPQPPAQPPVVLNGQIMPGEVDRFLLQLRRGQKLVIAAQARNLIPYLADAVPGWFQAVLAMYDSNGKELVYEDDCGYDPDPAFVFQTPQDGQYVLEVRDALYRGREDFVYRVDVGDETLIKSLFPLGSRGGVPIGAARPDLTAQTKLAQAHFSAAGEPPSQRDEIEPNDTGRSAMPITLPYIISGSISSPGDKDVFGFKGCAGDEVVAEVYARRMGSPLDSLLRLIDSSGHVVALNDDHEDMETGLLTHHADSYLSARLPKTGDYFLQLSDAQGHGSAEYRYCLRVGTPQPDFALRLTPSSLNVPVGGAVTATVYALRKDGWDGDIEVALKDAPPGFKLSGARIPKGRDQVRMTLMAPRRRFDQPVVIHLEGRAQITGKTVTRPVAPAENEMQAFAYHHLVSSEQLMVMVTRGGRMSPILDMAKGDRLRIPAGGSAKVAFSIRPSVPNTPITLELSEPPAGVTIQDTAITPSGFELVLKADSKHIGYADNLIIEAFTEELAARPKAGPLAQKRRVSLGVLPAIPFEIVQQ